MNRHCDLSGKSGTLSNTLSVNLDRINSITEPTELRNYISGIVTSVNLKSNKSVATVRFINSLNRLSTCSDIYGLVYNTILSGDNLSVLK